MSGRGVAMGSLLLCATMAGAQASRSFHITGTVINSTNGAPVANAQLDATSDKSCSGSSKEAGATADAQGHFSITVTCPSVWRLTAEASGFPQQSYEQHDSYFTGIVLNLAQPAFDLTFRLAPNGSITGTVLDEAGDAVREAKVTLLTDAGTQDSHPVASSITDDRGYYEFANLLPGSYQVAVQAQPWYAVAGSRTSFRFGADPASAQAPSPDPSLDFTYPITFFPGVTDSAAATSIPITGGSPQQADFHLSPIPSIHLILPASGRVSNDRNPNAVLRRAFDVPPIEEHSELGSSRFQPTSVTINADGTIDLGGFSPGSYAFNHFGQRQRDNGEEDLLNIQADAPRTVTLAAARAAAAGAADSADDRIRLAGTTFFNKQAAQGAMLLLVPATLGQPHSHASIRRQQTNSDGSFAFEHLAPGKYILVAIDHGWGVDWRNTASLMPYLLHGTPIDLTTSTTLKQPVEAQAP